jgi:hypothetical protein
VDAYTRVSLSEDLTFYTKGALKAIADGITTANTVTVDAPAIEDSVTNWNAQDEDDTTDDFYKVVAAADGTDASAVTAWNKLAGIIKSGTTSITPVAEGTGLHLYAKVDVASSQDSDAKTTETGDNISLLGYYLDAENNVAYEVKITPNIVYTSNVANDGNPAVDSTSKKSVWTDYIDYTKSTIDVQVYTATKVEVTDSKISDYVEIEFNNDGSWYYEDGYFYYRSVLVSGQSTTPLIKAVRLKNDVGDEMINATYNLKVNDESTQATAEAAKGVFGTTEFITATASNITGTNGCAFSKTEGALTVCSADTASDTMKAFNATRKLKDDVSIAQTTPTVDESTTSTSSTSTTEEAKSIL